jgi:Zn-finger nucleic acid-binding protein
MVAALTCPRCAGGLKGIRTRSVELSGCEGCGGVWLDNAAARRVIDALCDDTVGRVDALARVAQRPTDRAQSIACPSCAGPLARWSVPEANVDVDWCERHGTWFDRDELATVARTYAARRAYGGSGSGKGKYLAAGVAAGAVAGGAVGAAVLANDPSIQERARQAVDGIDAETVVDAGSTALEFVDPGDVADGAGVVIEGAGAVLENAGDLFGALGDILGGL